MAAGKGGAGAAASSSQLSPDGDAFPDRPYNGVYDSGRAPDATHILEVSEEDGLFSGYAVCGEAPDGWVWSLSGTVTCRACLRVVASSAAAGVAAAGKGRRP